MNVDFMKSGIVVPILTPIDENELIDEHKLREQVDFVIDGGVVGVLAFGSNGEFYMACLLYTSMRCQKLLRRAGS